jgi:hypothetical protein
LNKSRRSAKANANANAPLYLYLSPSACRCLRTPIYARRVRYAKGALRGPTVGTQGKGTVDRGGESVRRRTLGRWWLEMVDVGAGVERLAVHVMG